MNRSNMNLAVDILQSSFVIDIKKSNHINIYRSIYIVFIHSEQTM